MTTHRNRVLLLSAFVFLWAGSTLPPQARAASSTESGGGSTSDRSAGAFVSGFQLSSEPETIPEKWTWITREDSASFTQMELAENSPSPGAIAGMVDLSKLPQEDNPTGAKVPEPAALGLLGTGLIAIARASRMGRLPKSAIRLAAAPNTCIVPR